MLSLPTLLATALLNLSAPAETVWVRTHDVAVPMRDGVVLRADVLRPVGSGPFPVLVYRTPYGKDDAVTEYTTFRRAVERGYAVVVQDVRGLHASDGAFEAYRQEGPDGYDTIEWAASQPWSDGRVGTFGLSYPGAVQWLAALEQPPHLKAMVPAMTFASPRQFFYSGGAWDLSWASWVWFNIAPELRRRQRVAGPTSEAEVRAAWVREKQRVLTQLPLLALPDFAGVAPWFYEWMRRDPTDAWWQWAELAGRYDRIDAAVLNLSGWHDEAYGPDGATKNFRGLQAAGKRTALLIGPWVHGVDATASTRSGARDFGASAAIEYDEVVLRWMDRHVRGIDNGVDRESPVRAFVMGANRWQTASVWPLPSLMYDTLYFGTGTLSRRPPSVTTASSRFVSDPSAPVTDPYDAAYGAHDFRALATRSDLLRFETAPLDSTIEVLGAMRAEVFLETDARDVDLYVQVYDVAPDGTAYNLMSPGLTVLRASLRNPRAGRQLLTRGRVYQLTFPDLLTGNRFAAGHRIRVLVMGAFHPHFSLNLQTGAHERASSERRAARITIRHDARHPSRLVLPVMAGPATR